MITTVKVLDDIDKKILKLAGEGLTVKEMAPKVEKSPHTISVRIREMKKYYGCKNLAQLVKKTNMTKEKLQQLNGFSNQFYDLEADIEHLKKCTINIPSVFTDGILFRLNTESPDLQKKISSKLSGLYLDLTILIEKELKEDPSFMWRYKA